MTRVKLEDGFEVVTFAPPSGFDPLIASPDDLEKNGFPAIPPDGPLRERYKRVWNQLRDKFHYVRPTFRLNGQRAHGPRIGSGGTSTNWSGAAVYANGRPFRSVQADWVVPGLYAALDNKQYYGAVWIGLDGASGFPSMLQAGVECDVINVDSTVTVNVYPFWQWYPGPEVQIGGFPIVPGDMVTMVICTDKGGRSWLSLINHISGASTSVMLTPPKIELALKGQSAEWIVEAPTVGGSVGPLSDYGQVFFDNCSALTTDYATVDVSGATKIAMLSSGDIMVSAGAVIAPNIIQCQYMAPP
jgi:Peptidase A4 family